MYSYIIVVDPNASFTSPIYGLVAPAFVASVNIARAHLVDVQGEAAPTILEMVRQERPKQRMLLSGVAEKGKRTRILQTKRGLRALNVYSLDHRPIWRLRLGDFVDFLDGCVSQRPMHHRTCAYSMAQHL